MGLPDKTPVVQESFDFWKASGLPDVSIYAELGNEEGECSFNVRALGDKTSPTGPAYSIRQWHWHPRGERILAGCGIDIRTCSHADALKAALWEMQHVCTSSWKKMLAAKTIEEAVTVLVTEVENSKLKNRDIMRRTILANKWAGVFLEDSLPPAPAKGDAS